MNSILASKQAISGHNAAITYGISFTAILLVTAYSYVHYGFAGMDYGPHWDESRILDSIKLSASTGVLLPGWYNYPSLTYLLTTSVSAVYLMIELLWKATAPGNEDTIVQLIKEVANSLDFEHLKLTLRKLFFLTTLGGIAALMVATRLCGAAYWSTLISGIVALCSFQLFYHARWIAPDSLVFVTASMSLASSLWALRSDRTVPFLVATLCSSLVVAAKYPGGIFLLHAFLVANWRGFSWKRTALVLCICGVVFFLTTPGALVDPLRFLKDVIFEIKHYSVHGHGTYSVEAGLPHLRSMLDFFLFRAESQQPFASMLVFALAVLGAYLTFRRDRSAFCVLCVTPILYVLYFSTQRVMIVRNLLAVFPFIFVLAAVAVDHVSRVSRKQGTTAVILVLIALHSFASVKTMRDTTGSLHADSSLWGAKIEMFIETHGASNIMLSKQALEILGSDKLLGRKLAAPESSVDFFLFVLGELDLWEASPIPPYFAEFANRRSVYEVLAGPNDIDLDYYPTWLGKKRLIAVSGRHAEHLRKQHPQQVGIFLSRVN